MNAICNAAITAALQPPIPPPILRLTNQLHSSQSHFLHTTLSLSLSFPSKRPIITLRCGVRACASSSEIDMVKNKEGVYAPKQKKVVILWDLDNKPPRGPPYQAAMSLKRVAERFGHVVDVSAYANRHAFVHLPQWVLDQRRQRKNLDILERKGVVIPSEPYVCGVCGRKCRTNLDLKKHFRQLHERERQKKLNRLKSLKGKKRQRFKERYISGNHKYNEAARELLTPKVGYGLSSELRRAGVYVRTVEDEPQAADWALRRQMQHSMSRGIDWLFLVSDDSDFSEMLRRAREANLGTVVVGDWDKALGRHADVWVPWIGVENGEITESDLVPRRRSGSGISEVFDDDDDGFDVVGDLDSVVDELVMTSDHVNGVRISVFSEGEEEEESEAEEMGEEDYYLFGDSDEMQVQDWIFCHVNEKLC